MVKAAAIAVPVVLGVFGFLAAILYRPLALRFKVLGISRSFGAIQNNHGEDLHVIEGTHYCEDLHYHKPSNRLFAASEENEEFQWKWCPPMDVFKDVEALGRGTVVVIDAKTHKATRLSLKNFSRAFNTHGIDIWSPSDDPTSIFIFAVNHLPNPSYSTSSNKTIPRARSRIELFHHAVGTTEAIHLRSIWHPLIRTPNDIYARSSNEFYVTNDHYYREGPKKLIEDIGYDLAPWTDIIHISLSSLQSEDDTANITATVAIKGLHNNNGLGRGKNENEILIADASAGKLILAKPSPHPFLDVVDSVQLPCTIDNPSYFEDYYVKETGRDTNGYVLAGLAKAAAFPNGLDPVMVWLVQPASRDLVGKGDVSKKRDKWSQRLLFQDGGNVIRSASTAILVAIDPKENEGRKQAWLYVTGPVAHGIVVTKVDL